MTIRVASFNVENLMSRFDFASQREKGRSAVLAHGDDARQMTALAIAQCAADIVCLQEVEDLATLQKFEDDYLYPMKGLAYKNKVWIEGNDGRGIDVALMARERTAFGEKIEILKATTHRQATYSKLGVFSRDLADMGVDKKARIFRRDCLEVDVRIGSRRVTFFVVHFKSMGSDKVGVSGRDHTMPVRLAEAKAVRKIIEKKFGTGRAHNMRWMICGDLNDYTERLMVSGNKQDGYSFDLMQEETSGIEPLFADGFSNNLISLRDTNSRWSLYYSGGPVLDVRHPEVRETRQLVQLDYLLASPVLAKANPNVIPDIIRNGQPFRTVFPTGQDVERYPRTGWDRPKASDHCPVAVTLKMS